VRVVSTKPPAYLFRYPSISKSVETKSTGIASILGALPASLLSNFSSAFQCLAALPASLAALFAASVRGIYGSGPGSARAFFKKLSDF
ncbi:hypothetical protein, partial [Thioclava atlantica]|uniref:hypothetical protein n=1 Tax=Thioclava atlantica TaxID=1317124 RepID=UPI001EE1D903